MHFPISFLSFLFCLKLCFVSHCLAEPRRSSIMQENIALLGPNASYVFMDLGISEKEFELIDRLKVEQRQYDRYGNLELLLDELPTFLRDMGNNDEEVIQTVTNIIFQIACDVAEAYNKETAWITVRAVLPNDQFDMPRWHADGYYYHSQEEIASKFATVLKGNSTLFYDLPKELRAQFKELNKDYKNRKILSELLDVNKAVSAPRGYGAFFVVGHEEYAAVHSEPKMDKERLFFSVVPGNANEIQEFYQKNLDFQKNQMK